MKILSIQPSISAIKNTLGNSSSRNLFSRIIKPQSTTVTGTFKVADKPLIANIKTYYRTAIEKLNDIYLEKVKNRSYTGTAEHGDIIAEAGAEHITELTTETLHESLADEIAETATEIGAETAQEGIVDHIIDTALG